MAPCKSGLLPEGLPCINNNIEIEIEIDIEIEIQELPGPLKMFTKSSLESLIALR